MDKVGPTWAERAFEHDRLAIFPAENWNDLKRMGFLGLCVPQRLGGIGADYRTYMLVASRIGYYCGSTANTFNMHNANALWTADMVDQLDLTPEQKARLDADPYKPSTGWHTALQRHCATVACRGGRP